MFIKYSDKNLYLNMNNFDAITIQGSYHAHGDSAADFLRKIPDRDRPKELHLVEVVAIKYGEATVTLFEAGWDLQYYEKGVGKKAENMAHEVYDTLVNAWKEGVKEVSLKARTVYVEYSIYSRDVRCKNL